MEFSEVVRKRTSIRSFSKKEVADEQLREIIREAQRAPSWVNSQPWKVYIAKGKTLEKLKNSHLLSPQMGLSEQTDWPTLSRVNWDSRTQENMADWLAEVTTAKGGESFSPLQAFQFHAPVYVYLTIPKTTPIYSAFDLGAFAQTLMLSAQNKGIDSIVAYELIRFPSLIKQEMGIPDEENIAIGIALGYKDDHPLNQYVSSRVELDSILHIKK
ncbi:nitroreductase [Streptococcus himalayensis]|uniref:Nitrobenzoate reductase n=1 Tax=Streptococcus himalayensis TaxID=1888195 RepID=A0A917A9L1_9STRE|nr:nitroreductase [Streptococcus himalayensis]GGE37509.1 nitrobenzoate reductase [Streptococcus himalayensis]